MGHVHFFFNAIKKKNCKQGKFCLCVCVHVNAQKYMCPEPRCQCLFYCGLWSESHWPRWSWKAFLSFWNQCPTFPPEPDGSPMEHDWFLQVLPHWLLSKTRDSMVKRRKPHDHLSFLWNTSGKKPLSLLPWCLRLAFELEMGSATGDGPFKSWPI